MGWGAMSGRIQSANLDGSNETNIVGVLRSPFDLNIYNERIYWANAGTSEIKSCALDGSDIDTVVSGEGVPSQMTIDNNYIYWNSGNGVIRRSNLDGTSTVEILNSSEDGISSSASISFTDNFIYWTESGESSIQRSELDGSDVTALVTENDGVTSPNGATIHNNQIYWTDHGSGKIQRADLPSRLGNGTSDFTLQIGGNNSENDRMTFGIESVTTDSLLVSDTGVSTLQDKKREK